MEKQIHEQRDLATYICMCARAHVHAYGYLGRHPFWNLSKRFRTPTEHCSSDITLLLWKVVGSNLPIRSGL